MRPSYVQPILLTCLCIFQDSLIILWGENNKGNTPSERDYTELCGLSTTEHLIEH